MLMFVSVNPITTSLCHEAGETLMHMIGCVSQGFIIMYSKFWISDEKRSNPVQENPEVLPSYCIDFPVGLRFAKAYER